MAASSKRESRRKCKIDVDYVQMNSLSSVVLYNSKPKRRDSKFYAAERVITRRKKPYVSIKTAFSQIYSQFELMHCEVFFFEGDEYLIKWQGWPYHSCSWEPSENLSIALLRSYEQPLKPDGPKFEQACRDFMNVVQTSLKSKSVSPVYVNMPLDVWRYITLNKGKKSDHKGHMLYEKEHFDRFKGLPHDWYYVLNQHGEGICVDFPIKAKPIVSWSPSRFTIL
ncbi:Hypothetical predicted protein [Paramuricea clavata]|uniref:Uncharacterized protein n=1 Tax=Paramuricea clavata TaxID=317549 RepID=A0A6S7J658_PARCT|nr:Hypothetical predicted protein [Paramuricea clavata]